MSKISSRDPSLRSQYAYYVEMAEALDTPEHDRPVWQALAEGLAPRLDQDPEPEDQPGLW